MLAVVRNRAIHHAADQFHVALLPVRSPLPRASTDPQGNAELLWAPTSLDSRFLRIWGPEDEASAMPRWDRQKIARFRRGAHATRARCLKLGKEQPGQRGGVRPAPAFLTRRLPGSQRTTGERRCGSAPVADCA